MLSRRVETKASLAIGGSSRFTSDGACRRPACAPLALGSDSRIRTRPAALVDPLPTSAPCAASRVVLVPPPAGCSAADRCMCLFIPHPLRIMEVRACAARFGARISNSRIGCGNRICPKTAIRPPSKAPRCSGGGTRNGEERSQVGTRPSGQVRRSPEELSVACARTPESRGPVGPCPCTIRAASSRILAVVCRRPGACGRSGFVASCLVASLPPLAHSFSLAASPGESTHSGTQE
jgi:hypothetical protein